ncbi:MAG TPA: hypothetical protein VGO58_18425 [Chitinophagaceae bacterium]|nr:hypothetical protein [Chitinophagaceae bacterium]
MKPYRFILIALPAILLFSCVSSKKFKAAQNEYTILQTRYTSLQGELNTCNDDKANLNGLKTGWKMIMLC